MIEDITNVARDIVEDNKSKDFAFLYQPLEAPEEIIKTLVDDTSTINAISKEINKANKILVVGHSSPDGDSIGCVLGLGNALKHIDKDVDFCIDDDIPGLFRNNLPGLGLFKDNSLFKYASKALSLMFNNKLYDDDQKLKKARDLNPDKNYDLVIVMDTPTPKRIGEIKHFIKNKDTQLIVIDHHPLRQFEWDADKENTGVDLNKVIIIQPDHLAEGHDVLMGLLNRNAIGLFIVDSIAALLPKSVIENEADASNIGKHAQAIGNMFKISNSYVGKQGVTAIWINQIRDQIGGYGGGIDKKKYLLDLENENK